MTTKRIVVGSKNRVKIEAAREVFTQIFKDVEIVGVEVDSGVGAQPFTQERTILGAINRAKNALKKLDGDYGVGIEGGIFITSFGAFVNGWVAITDGKKFGIGSSISVQLPKSILKMFEDKEIAELEEGIEKISDIHSPGESIGAIGVLTNRLLDRKKAFVDAIKAAMAPFLTNYYD
ncbi:MAG: inosine/xanthosine triphosphatase [Candidatus Njordarchaeia archaeon]